MTTMTSPSSNQRSDKFASHLEGYAAQTKGKTGLKRIINAAGYSKDGLVAAYQNEAAFRQVSWLNSILLVVLIFLPFMMPIKMILVFSSFFLSSLSCLIPVLKRQLTIHRQNVTRWQRLVKM